MKVEGMNGFAEFFKEGILQSLADANFPQRTPDELLSLIRSYYRLI